MSIENYYLEQRDIFYEKFRLVCSNFEIEDIHKMRTTTKRLRALFLFIEYISPQKFKTKKQLRKVREIFKFTGRIRELQIEQGLVNAFQTNNHLQLDDYIEYLHKRELQEEARFLKKLPKISKRENILNDEVILGVIRDLEKIDLKKAVEGFVNNRTGNVLSDMKGSPSNHRIHHVRTLSKQLYYLFDLLVELSGTQDLLGMESLRLREIEQTIGNWHDLVNSRIYSESFLKTKRGKQSKDIRKFKALVSAERKALRKLITQKLYPELKTAFTR